LPADLDIVHNDLGPVRQADTIQSRTIAHLQAGSERMQPTRTSPRPARTPASDKTATAPGLTLGPLPNLLGYALRRAQLTVFAEFLETFAKIDLRPAEFSALVLIDANPGCKQSAAAEALGIMQPNFVALMDALEAGGLARRAPAKTDRRSHALELTPKGRQLLARALAVVEAHEARVSINLTATERNQLFALLARIKQPMPAPAER
jgi:DNA-binding MarR family transcriptional regulator